MVMTFNRDDAISLCKNIIIKLENIFEDENGLFFYGGSMMQEIESDYNREIIEDNESRLRRVFKNHSNWSNMRKSQKMVGNYLRWIITTITNKKKIDSVAIRFGNHVCKKYYIPDSIFNLDI